MSLKESIVVVNEYTIKNRSGKGGSRGGSPGDYVTRYMARNGATEDLTPVKYHNTDEYITRYMARSSATESVSSVPEMKRKFRKSQGYGGVAFGYGDVSLSDEKLRFASKDIQSNFDRGKTVLKTVISFDEDYLRKNHIIDEDFVFEKKGDYRGNIDQLKLRMAIMNGLKKMSRQYDDLQYVGVIQVDTGHVHCHLAMVDRGEGMLASDGTQRGKINEVAKRDLRRGIDMFLDEKQTVRMLSSNVTQDKRNALCYIKKFTHQVMDQHGLPQFLLACLPDDKRLWRAGTNRKEMRKANTIVREYVTEILNEPDSGFEDAMKSVYAYAKERSYNEGLSMKEYRTLVKNGQERIIGDCINTVYGILKQIPDEYRTVRTPMMHAMSMNMSDMAAKVKTDPMVEFGFRLRSYSSRLDHHKKEMHKYHDLNEAVRETEHISEDAKPLLDFYKFEEEYNAKLMCKYQWFLSFLPQKKEYEDEFADLLAYKQKITQMQRMRTDPSMRRMKPDSAEDYGLRVYDMHGGRYTSINPDILKRRQTGMEATYAKKKEAFQLHLSDYGLTLDAHGVSTKKPYEFDDVKSLDIHHLGYDFYTDIAISKTNVDTFIETAETRSALLQGAVSYLEASGQGDLVSFLPVTYVHVMKDMADRLNQRPVLVYEQPAGGGSHSARTVTLDADYEEDLKLAVKATAQSVHEM